MEIFDINNPRVYSSSSVTAWWRGNLSTAKAAKLHCVSLIQTVFLWRFIHSSLLLFFFPFLLPCGFFLLLINMYKSFINFPVVKMHTHEYCRNHSRIDVTDVIVCRLKKRNERFCDLWIWHELGAFHEDLTRTLLSEARTLHVNNLETVDSRWIDG